MLPEAYWRRQTAMSTAVRCVVLLLSALFLTGVAEGGDDPAMAQPGGDIARVAGTAEGDDDTAPAYYVEGVHYTRLPVSVQPMVEEGIEVIEFFSYACVHCYHFDPVIEQWHKRQPPDVAFLRVPAVFSKTWQTYAQTYYAAEALGILDIAHTPIFSAVHKQRRLSARISDLARFFTSFGVTEEDFMKAVESFGVHTRVRQADGMGRAYRISSVPSLTVGGRYRVGFNEAVPDAAELLKVVDFLVAGEREREAGSRISSASGDGERAASSKKHP